MYGVVHLVTTKKKQGDVYLEKLAVFLLLLGKYIFLQYELIPKTKF